jgi:plastocyanin
MRRICAFSADPVRRSIAGRRSAASLASSALVLFAVFCANPAQAAVYVVTANPDMTFTPADITIYQGDSILFENAGGLHNVHADDDSFECSLDCNLHSTPSSEPWRSSRRFNRLGTLGYYCDQHGNLDGGMRGSITVIDRVFVDGFEAPGAPPEMIIRGD